MLKPKATVQKSTIKAYNLINMILYLFTHLLIYLLPTILCSTAYLGVYR